MLIAGVDMGGTFTDGYLADDQRVVMTKVPTYRFDLPRSVVQCLRVGAETLGHTLAELLDRIEVVRLSTTVGTNAVIEGTGSRVGLLVAEGQETSIYGANGTEALFANFVRSEDVRGLPPDFSPDDVLRAVRELVTLGVRQVVASVPWSGDGASSEQRIREIVRGRYPEHYLRSVPLQLAAEVTACPDDGVRTATAALNAYLHRDMARLLQHADQTLRAEGMHVPLLVVHANAGVARIAKSTALSTYGAGPSAGLSGAQAIARRYGDAAVMTADMGGTTLDLGFISDGACETHERPHVAGVEVALPINRTQSVGCGGSSIARVHEDRVLLGPDSAGAVPGPAAFARGGEQPTLTDADLLTGLLEAGQEFGDQFVLDAGAARDAIRSGIAEPLHRSTLDAAVAVEAAATAVMSEAFIAFLEQRNVDPAEVTLYAFGGAGPLHAWAAATAVGIRRIRTFAVGSGLSAYGCTVLNVRHRYELAWDGASTVERGLAARLEAAIRRGFGDLASEGFNPAKAAVSLRVLGRGAASLGTFEAPCGSDATNAATLLIGSVATGTTEPDLIEVIAVEVVVPVVEPQPGSKPRAARPASPPGTRDVWWGEAHLATPVYRSDSLPTDKWVDGPALLTDAAGTHAIGPGWRVRLDELGNAVWEAQ